VYVWCIATGGFGGLLVGGVLADHRENGISVRVVRSRYGLEGGSPSGRYSPRMSESTSIIGRWRITEMDNWDQEAVDLVQPGFIEFDDDGLGSLGFIVVTGELDCRDAAQGAIEDVRARGAGRSRHRITTSMLTSGKAAIYRPTAPPGRPKVLTSTARPPRCVSKFVSMNARFRWRS
jgi:hypothetical protein